ncbi:nuclear transport factor 2 family protein [Pseudarthrobacter sp. NamE2]|uniref:nuclear transport factor 2 family protein n=1 Tax=Pseudarthrobacter sp. NamE2 TaxID=2576838 RepID=UPI0010FD177E|nr:nuclear transport factor 2 family protein [Pseudarthrobacter sp. NamE2]TLM82694.1 nuclear transport factor 2 family protein [Pseudarthrobacter sp. NamE2]
MLKQEVLDAALARADALRRRDGEQLRRLLHPQFRWVSHKGDHFDRDSYLKSNTEGQNTWHAQILEEPEITILGTAAVLTCTVKDDVSNSAGRRHYRMPMTQVWVHEGTWKLVAGHAGPLIESP